MHLNAQAAPDPNIEVMVTMLRDAMSNPRSRFADVLHRGIDLVREFERQERTMERQRPAPLNLAGAFAQEANNAGMGAEGEDDEESERPTDLDSSSELEEEQEDGSADASSISRLSASSTISLTSSAESELSRIMAEESEVESESESEVDRSMGGEEEEMSPRVRSRVGVSATVRASASPQSSEDSALPRDRPFMPLPQEVIRYLQERQDRVRRDFVTYLHDLAWSLGLNQIRQTSTPSIHQLSSDVGRMARDLHDLQERERFWRTEIMQPRGSPAAQPPQPQSPRPRARRPQGEGEEEE